MPTLQATRFDELKATGQLPSPTGVALQILRLAEEERATATEIARILQADPALAGRVLKLANGTSHGRGRPVTSVREAVTHLGTRLVRSVALGFSLVSQHGQGVCPGFDYGAFWSRSLAMGVAAQSVADFVGKIAPSEAFTCGLLGQVGCLALASIYPDDYGQILARVEPTTTGHLGHLERERFATDHNELSAALMRDWGLPEACADAVHHHEAPDQSSLPDDSRPLILARLLHLASLLADVCVARDEERSSAVLDLFASGEILNIAGPDLIEMCDRVVGEWQDWGKVLQVGTRAVPPMAELAERARGAQEEATATAPAPMPDYASPLAAGEYPLRIVVVEDNPVELRLMVSKLTAVGHSVREARDGSEGLRTVLEVNPELVITDRNMPGMDGVSLIKALRQTKLGRRMCVLMLTAADDEESRIEAFEAGADDYLVKPCRPKLLAARVLACQRILRLQKEVESDRQELHRCMADLGVANRKLQQAALTDALTGLYNRRFALERLDQAWAEATRGQLALSCLVIDIDHFKKINDTYGHDIGDRVLTEIANVLRSSLRGSDVVCRLGGEEFVVIAPGMALDTLALCGERLRRKAEENVLRLNDTTAVRVTLSVGGATRTPAMASPADLLKAADLAVYAAKQGGRNRVCLAREH